MLKEMKYGDNHAVTIIGKGNYDGFNWYILNLGLYPTAYVEIPKTHKYYGKHYDDIDINVHGGLTYSEDYLQEIVSKSWIIGWDYAHFGDFSGAEMFFPTGLRLGDTADKKWTTEEIYEDVKSVIRQLGGTDE